MRGAGMGTHCDCIHDVGVTPGTYVESNVLLRCAQFPLVGRVLEVIGLPSPFLMKWLYAQTAMGSAI
jgi:hypothetical protein